MNMNEKVRELIKSTLLLESEEVAKIGNEDDLELIGLNSVIMLQFIVKMEQEFDIEIDEEEIIPENLGTVNKVVQYLEKKNIQ